MPNRTHLVALLAAALVAGAAITLTLSNAAAGPAFIVDLPLVSRADVPTVTPTSTAPPAPPTDAPTATSSPTTAGPTQQPPGCDHSYPTICIPYPPPDLDCGDIPYRNFQVVSPDDHHFDSDHDGIGCESP